LTAASSLIVDRSFQSLSISASQHFSFRVLAHWLTSRLAKPGGVLKC
jgi:hypothetical protein